MWKLTLTITLLPLSLWALVQKSALPYYALPTSSFSSGQASVDQLLEYKEREEAHTWYELATPQKKYLVKAEQILTSLDVSLEVELLSDSPVYENPFKNPHFEKIQSKGTKVFLLKIENGWGFIDNTKTQASGWVPLTQLTPSLEDLGVLVTINKQKLLLTPDASSPAVTWLMPKTRLKVKNFFKYYAAVEVGPYIGYVDLRQISSRLDFSVKIRDPQKEWQEVKTRMGPYVNLKNGQRLHLSEITGFETKQNFAIVIDHK